MALGRQRERQAEMLVSWSEMRKHSEWAVEESRLNDRHRSALVSMIESVSVPVEFWLSRTFGAAPMTALSQTFAAAEPGSQGRLSTPPANRIAQRAATSLSSAFDLCGSCA
jgi:hypothetical protein